MEATSPDPQNRLSQKVKALQDRAQMMGEVRQFFHQRGVTEVDCPLLSAFASVDAHIDLISADSGEKSPCFLHSSPEYGMKRLLSLGMGDIYQMSHVFRKGERGRQHNPEFTLVEWYRRGFSFQNMVEETAALIRLFLGDLPLQTMTYREALVQYAGLDYLHCDVPDLQRFLGPHHSLEGADRDDLLNLILGNFVEPRLGQKGLAALTHFPSSQAALAQCTEIDGEQVAERFEIYYQGRELSNGYHELANPQEQARRFQEANEKRRALGKATLPVDRRFLKALETLPPCCGVAVGFDRLMMLRHGSTEISEVLPFPWGDA